MKIIGIDEAGRGPLAGPVAIGAVQLDPNKEFAIIPEWMAVYHAKILQKLNSLRTKKQKKLFDHIRLQRKKCRRK